MKLWLRRTHLALALISGLFLLIISVTGALLIYAKDLQHLMQADKWLVTEHAKHRNYNELIAHVQQQTGQPVHFFMPETNPTLAWQFKLVDNSYVSVNPYTNDILYRYQSTDTLYGFTLALHRWLLWQDNDGNKPLQNWVSVCALMLIINLLIGFYLWVKPNKRLKRLAIKPSAKLRVLLYQLHTVLGVYLFIPLILIAFTGMAFNWKSATQTVLEFVTVSHIEQRPTPPSIVANPTATPRYTMAINNAHAVFQHAPLYRVYLPQKADQALAIRVKNPGESHAFSWVWVNPYTAKVINAFDASKTNVTTQAWHFKYAFHIGNFAGPVVQFLWLLLTLSLSFFVISGIYFWLKRLKRNKSH